ncbi:hypothetical protein ANN_05939 [Periplaneta americana]|uniref:Gamma-tubulin complex component n=1 Tax=Periplaneta americana TaxID=6978 RepID=A0ABQ8TEM8_PERAM|nr:hypothetical protein ANN_05939 [Periplaneta americana]
MKRVNSLLSVIYEQLTHASSNKQSATLLKLFLTSFQVYLDIFDTWLTEGQLQDSREEFVIARSKDKLQKPDEEFIIQPYESELLNGGVKPLPVLQVIVNKALHAGRSIELLRRLDRLSELGKRSDEQGHLYEELITLIEHDLSKFASDTENESLVKTNDDDIITHCDMENGDNFMSEVKDHLLRVGDPFLVKGFESYLNLNQGNQTSQQCNEDMGNNLKRKKQICIKLMQHFKNKILPVKPVLEINLLKLVEEKWKAVCCMVKPIFQNEFNLPLHFQMIRGVFLMECDDIMQQFYSSLFTQVQACEANSFSLTIHLESCLDQRYPDFSSRFSVVVNKKIQYATTVQDAINSIKLRYAVEWPITLILNERNMEYYNAVFQFLLKIKWALFSLQKLRFSAFYICVFQSDLDQRENKSVPLRKKEKERMQRLQYLRFWLLHSVNSVHSYLMGQVLHLLHLELERNLEEAQELDAVIKAHDSYVQTVYAHCLQSEGCEIIKQSTLQMVWTALRLCEAWATGAIFVSDARLQELEELYAKHHVFLAVTLSNCVENDTRSHCKSTGFPNMCSHNVVSTGCNKSPLCILCYFKMNDVIDNPADCEVRSVIRFLNAQHLKPAEIYRQLKEVYGDTVMNERNVRKWCEMFNNGRTNVHDETRPGRPSLITEDLKTKVNNRILQDRRTSLDELHIAFRDISRSLLGEIVSQHLGYHKICARWVPRQLSDQHKTQRMASALTFLMRYHTDGDAFLDQIVTGDETWVSHNTQRPSANHTLSTQKVVATVFWDRKGVLLLDFMPKGTTINANRYCETLRKLRRAIQNKRRGMLSRGVVLLHDNARPHTAASTRELLDQFGWEIFDHPPYSPDLAPSDFHLFTKLKDFLGGTRFGSDEELKKTVNTWLNELAAEEYNTGILKLVNRYDKCLNVGGDYVEK